MQYVIQKGEALKFYLAKGRLSLLTIIICGLLTPWILQKKQDFIGVDDEEVPHQLKSGQQQRIISQLAACIDFTHIPLTKFFLGST